MKSQHIIGVVGLSIISTASIACGYSLAIRSADPEAAGYFCLFCLVVLIVMGVTFNFME